MRRKHLVVSAAFPTILSAGPEFAQDSRALERQNNGLPATFATRWQKIEGVEKVVNNIEVLPLSPNDDRIRKAVYRAGIAANRVPGVFSVTNDLVVSP